MECYWGDDGEHCKGKKTGHYWWETLRSWLLQVYKSPLSTYFQSLLHVGTTEVKSLYIKHWDHYNRWNWWNSLWTGELLQAFESGIVRKWEIAHKWIHLSVPPAPGSKLLVNLLSVLSAFILLSLHYLLLIVDRVLRPHPHTQKRKPNQITPPHLKSFCGLYCS